VNSLETVWQDVRFGARTLAKNPGFTAAAVLALALGVGANTAILSVVDAVLVQPLDYADPERLVVALHGGTAPVSPANFLDWRKQNGVFERMGAAEYWTPNLGGSDRPEKVWALRLTADVLPLLGVPPLLGRVFSEEEERPGADRVLVLGHSLWRRRFGADPDVVGRSVTVNGEPHTVIGVMPPGFRFAPFWATRAEMWAPLPLADRASSRSGNSLRVFARLKQDVTLAQARSELKSITARLEAAFPGTNRNVELLPLKERVVGSVQQPLLVLLGAVAFVLLIACANVAHLLLARGANRRRELAVRSALGGSRARLLRQLLSESLLLALGGGSAGLVIAAAAIRTLVALSPGDIPRLADVALNARMLAATFGVSLAAGVLFGLAPAWRAAQGGASDALKEGERGATSGPRRSRLRSLLIASESALALVLLVGAGLLIRSFAALQAVDPGFDPRNVLSLVVSVTGSTQASPERRAAFFREALARLEALPGVERASAVNHLPLAGDIWTWPLWVEGREIPAPGEEHAAAYRVVLPGYFETMRLALVRGRDFDASDRLDSEPVVIVNEHLARRLWGAETPLGKRLTLRTPGAGAPWLRVVGVVENAAQKQWGAEASGEMYLPYLQRREHLQGSGAHIAYLTLVARTSTTPTALAAPVSQAVQALASDVTVSEVQSLEQAVGEALARPRFYSMLLATFAVTALLLAAVGVYGVVSYSVSGRTREIGLLLALGASRADVLRAVVGQALRVILLGALVGLAAAFGLMRLISGLLYAVGPGDPLTFALVAFVLVAVALFASYLPARRALRIDPSEALRCE
jgi:putative ABC transport system permease protein